MHLPLEGQKIVLTRPKRQIQGLTERLSAVGAEPIAFPVIEIESIAVSEWPVMSLEAYDMVVFVSCNAVHHFMDQYVGPLPEQIQWVAVGAATANCMTERGLAVAVQAPPPAGSESLLALPDMQAVEGKRILIVRGETGRELLAETLTARGATIMYLAVYRRCLPTPEQATLTQVAGADWLVVTSVAGLENLCRLVNNSAIKHKILLVVSERIKQVAIGLGFQQVVVTDDVSDAAIVDRIVEIRTR